jgi:hypothetical protein
MNNGSSLTSGELRVWLRPKLEFTLNLLVTRPDQRKWIRTIVRVCVIVTMRRCRKEVLQIEDELFWKSCARHRRG